MDNLIAQADMANVTELTDRDMAYLAGIIDGEGSIEVRFLSGRPAKRTGLAILIRVANTDPRLIEWLVSRCGGRCYTSKRNLPSRDIHFWNLPVRANLVLSERLLGYLLLKREQLQLALEASTLSIVRGAGRTIPPDNLQRRREIVAECARLKWGRDRSAE